MIMKPFYFDKSKALEDWERMELEVILQDKFDKIPDWLKQFYNPLFKSFQRQSATETRAGELAEKGVFLPINCYKITK